MEMDDESMNSQQSNIQQQEKAVLIDTSDRPAKKVQKIEKKSPAEFFKQRKK